VIHQAVTGRIDVRTGRPYPAYKPSGVEWLGKVPHHWNVRRLRQCGTMVGGMTPSMVERRFWGGDIPWVTPKDMKRQVIHDSDIQVTKAALRETSIRLIEPPAVLMVVRGMILARKVPIAWIANCVTINQDMKAVVPAVGIKAEFLARALDSAQGALATLIDEAGHGTRRLPTERLWTLAVAIPPEDEQALVVRFVDQATTKTDKRIADTHREVDLLREYRTRLIADVVTGKLDVREAAAALPEEPDDPDAAETDCAEPEGGDDSHPHRDRRTEVPATQREMIS
ncbi:MAG: restriction endonuclease subunit S, partial [Thiotrichales bacterium]|nr:restriction endonuclease subunit S [Thiotrichales bacterium]